MNPLTLVKRIQKITATEAALGISEEASWHAKYKESAYVYIGGIPFDLTEGDLLAVFSQYGEIVDVNLVRDKGTGKSKGFAFLAYEDQRSTILAVDNLNGAKLLDRIIRVDHVTKYKKKEEEDEEEAQQKREARGVCRAFQRGECSRGAACKFSHDEQRAANTGSGPKNVNPKWTHDKYEGPPKSHGRSVHTPSDRTLGSKVEEPESKFRLYDADGQRSRAEDNYGGRNSHPKQSEPNSKDRDRRGSETWSDRHLKEPNPKEDQDRRTNEQRSGRQDTVSNSREDQDRRGSERHESEPNQEGHMRGNEKRSGRHESEPNPKDRDRRGSEKWSRYDGEERRPSPKENQDRRGSDKRSRHDEGSSRHHREEDESYHRRSHR
ncbi:RNA recognition motif (RRM)-containing protein [Tasmannia lanceolata]|uniref:RNA recognition motif (RRM)-containing protein n=1 Tax=Tasmannia lanceolata TaxID=3420 RepID=UPI004062A325